MNLAFFTDYEKPASEVRRRLLRVCPREIRRRARGLRTLGPFPSCGICSLRRIVRNEHHSGASKRAKPTGNEDERDRCGARCVRWETWEGRAQNVGCSTKENFGNAEEELGEKEGRKINRYLAQIWPAFVGTMLFRGSITSWNQ
jgi:hypothetical protein